MIDKEITLNGVEYIRKDAVENNDIIELRSIVAQILSETQENVDKIIDSYIKNDIKVPDNHIKQMTDDGYKIKIFPSSQKLYENFIVKHNGDIVVNGRTLPLDMYDATEIASNIRNITNEDAKSLSNKLNVSLGVLHRFIYNIIQGTFKGYKFNILNKPQKEKKTWKNNNNSLFTVRESHKVPYKLTEMTPTGELHAYKNAKFNLTIHQVLKIKSRIFGKDITVARAKQIASDVGVSYEVLHRVVYNIAIGTFDEYIEEWKARLNQSFDKTKKPQRMPVQNNAEKRMEAGYYTGGLGGY